MFNFIQLRTSQLSLLSFFPDVFGRRIGTREINPDELHNTTRLGQLFRLRGKIGVYNEYFKSSLELNFPKKEIGQYKVYFNEI